MAHGNASGSISIENVDGFGFHTTREPRHERANGRRF